MTSMNESTFSDGILVEQTVDNLDGTGTRTTYHPDGTVDSVEELTGLPIPPEPEPDPVANLQAQLAAQQYWDVRILAVLKLENAPTSSP